MASLACVGGTFSGLGGPGGPPTYDVPFAMGMYFPDSVAMGESFDVTVTSYKDPALGASNPPVTMETGESFTVEPTTYDVVYDGSGSHSKTVRVTAALEPRDAGYLKAMRDNPIGEDPHVSASISISPFRADFTPIEPIRIVPQERQEIDIEFTTTAFKPGRMRLVSEPPPGYQFTFSPEELSVAVGIHRQRVRLSVLPGAAPTGGVITVGAQSAPFTDDSHTVAQTRMQFLTTGNRGLTLEVTPAEVTLFPNSPSPEVTLTAIGRGGLGGIVNVDVERLFYADRTPSTNPLGFNLPTNGRGTQTFRWVWNGSTGTPTSKVVTYTANVDGQTYTATQRLNFQWEGLQRK